MKGIYSFRVKDRNLVYDISVGRNITIINDESATGKSELVRLISRYIRLGVGSGVFIEGNCNVIAITYDTSITTEFFSKPNTVFIVDEEVNAVTTKEFAEVLKETGAYVILINREKIPTLPYSIQEIYGVHKSGKYHTLYKLYKDYYSNNDIVTRVLTEDGKSSYYALRRVYDSLEVSSAKGNSNICKMIMDGDLVFVDGAAFGPYVKAVIELLRFMRFTVLLPESFEHILIERHLIELFKEDYRKAMSKDFDYKDYFSYEQFATSIVESVFTMGEQYSKSRDLKLYSSNDFKHKFRDYLEEVKMTGHC